MALPNGTQRPAVLILSGPNLNLLGTREPATYGHRTLADIEAACQGCAETLGLAIEFRQSNHEGILIDHVQQARGRVQGIVVNAAGLTHTSVALMDALAMFDGPIIEVHLSNIYRREPFRHHSYVSLVANGVICGLGSQGYTLALRALADMFEHG